jgi:hypothetical protein
LRGWNPSVDACGSAFWRDLAIEDTNPLDWCCVFIIKHYLFS